MHFGTLILKQYLTERKNYSSTRSATVYEDLKSGKLLLWTNLFQVICEKVGTRS